MVLIIDLLHCLSGFGTVQVGVVFLSQLAVQALGLPDGVGIREVGHLNSLTLLLERGILPTLSSLTVRPLMFVASGAGFFVRGWQGC